MNIKKLTLVFLAFCFFMEKNNAQVTADFTANFTSGCGTLAVSFTDESSSTAGAINNWQWDLGGVAVFTQTAGRIFPTGTYEICLTVTDDAGNSDTECKSEYIKVFQNPIANFSANVVEGCSPLAVEFDDLSSSPDGAITSWIWGVGGSNGVIQDDGTLLAISNVYDLPDEYDISLTLEDENGCIGTITQEDFITVFPDPEIQISANDSFTCTPPFLVTFSNNNIEPNVSYIWDFGNGDTHVGTTPPDVLYTEPGVYDVQVIGLNNSTGCLDTLMIEDYISVGYEVDFTHTPSDVCAFEEIIFEDISPGEADSVMWDFGDGSTSTEISPTHIFTAPGCYIVSLTRYEKNCATTIPISNCITVKPPPSVTFTVDENRGCSVPHVANFTGISTEAESWYWKFGDDGEAGTSTEQNPTVTFQEFGEYPVFLTVTDSEGCRRKVSMDTIKLVELDAALPAGQIQGCSPLTITLHDESQTVAPITSWNWTINAPSGPFTSTDATPTFTIPDTGCFDVQLIVVNALGCLDTTVINDAICGGLVPIVDFEATPLEACVNSDVWFTNLSSPFANEYFWDFGDNGTSFSSNPTHEFTDTGFFTVNLIAFHHGCANGIAKTDYIKTLAPKAIFNITQECNDPYTLNFIEKSIDADSRFFDFGDLTTTTDTSYSSMPSYTFPDTGVYDILLVTENFTTGCIDSAVVAYHITEPKAEFSFSENEGCVPLTISVVDNSAFAEQYQWINSGGVFSDNTIAEPTITFDTAGSYSDFKLVVIDEHDCPDTLDYSGVVEVNAVNVDFQSNPPSGCVPLTIQLQDNSASLFSNIVSWEWVVGDSLFLSNDESPTFTFDTIGLHAVTLTVTDIMGCQSTLTMDSVIYATQPRANFRSDTLGCTMTEIVFSNISKGDELSYLWDFGDNNTSIEKKPIHFYENEGTYTVCLTVTDVNGCVDTYCRTDDIRIANPVADFTSDNTFAACPPLIINFENLSQNATSYQWDFGDSSGVSNIENAPHVYTTPGIFDVSLIAIATEACQDTISIQDYITLNGPVGDFEFTYSDQCIPTEVTFTAQSNAFYTYIWDYGDGILDTTGFKMADTITHLYNQTLDFIPNLILVDAQGCSRAIPAPDTLELVSLEADFMASDTFLCGGANMVSFMNMTNTTAPLEILEWTFEAGTPATSFDLQPQVTFDSIGDFDVMLVVGNSYCMDTLIKKDFIRVGELPVADFQMTPDQGCEPLPVSFTDISTVNTGFIAEWDWSFGDGETSASQNPTHTFSAQNEMPIKLMVTTNLGCQDSMTQMLDIFPQINMTPDYATTVCKGESAQLNIELYGDTTGVTYSWQPNPFLSCTDCFDPVASPLDTMTFTFMATSIEGCTYFTEVTVQVRPEEVPNIVMSNDTTICANDVAALSALGGDDLFGYQWESSAPGLSCYNSCLNPIASPTTTTTYTVTVTNISGCSSIDSVTVFVIDQFQPFLEADRTICLGDTVHLQTQIGNNPTWLVTNGLSCTFCPNPVASPTETTTYLARVETDLGCEIFDSITVNVLTENDIDAGTDIDICLGQTAQLNGFGNGTPTWTPTTDLDDPNVFNPTSFTQSDITYTLTVENGDCILTDSVRISLLEKTEISLIDVTVCEGEAIVVQPYGFADEFSWSPPEGLSSVTSGTPLASPTETTEYTLIASLGTCEPDTAIGIVYVEDLPRINYPSIFRYFPNESVLLEPETNSNGNYAYQWIPATGLSCSDCPNPLATVDTNMVYTVFVTDLTTECSFSKEVNVLKINECSSELLSIPNGFTPNNDGNNDELKMYSGTVTEIEYFRVFNRWGALVYETRDRYFSWDGKMDGQNLPTGVYVYLMEAKCELDGSIIQVQGDITIYR